MKSSLRALPDFVSWCLERNIDINFQNLVPNRNTANEDILTNTKLLDEIDNWQGKLDRSIELLSDAGKKDTVFGGFPDVIPVFQAVAGAHVDRFLAEAGMKKTAQPPLTEEHHLLFFESSSQHHPIKHLMQVIF